MTFVATAMRSVLTLVVLSVTLSATGKPFAPVGLLVNGVCNPLAIERDMTRFTWRLEGNRRGESQSAYQILVASSSKRLASGDADYWDSGRVESGRSASVEYGGKPLPSARRFWWQVRVWADLRRLQKVSD